MPQKVSHDSHKDIRSYAAGQLTTAQENLPLDLQHSYSPQSARSHQSPSLVDSLTQVWLFLQTSLHCNKINKVTSQSSQVTWASVWKLHTELVTKECWIPTSVGKCIFICQHLVQRGSSIFELVYGQPGGAARDVFPPSLEAQRFVCVTTSPFPRLRLLGEVCHFWVLFWW